MRPPGDVLGFSRETWLNKGKTLYLCLMVALSDEMAAEGITGDPEELARRYGAALSGNRPCPVQGTCKRYKRAVERGGTPIRNTLVQLTMFPDWKTA